MYEIDFATGAEIELELEDPMTEAPPPHTPPVQQGPSDAIEALNELIRLNEEMGMYDDPPEETP